jgi:hypothetical protein
MDLEGKGKEGMYLMYLAQDMDRWRTVVKMVVEPSGSIKGGEFLD